MARVDLEWFTTIRALLKRKVTFQYYARLVWGRIPTSGCSGIGMERNATFARGCTQVSGMSVAAHPSSFFKNAQSLSAVISPG